MIFAFDCISDPPIVMAFNSVKDAQSDRNGWYIPANAERLANEYIRAPLSAMVKLYNSLADAPVTHFPDRLVAAKRLWEVLEENLTPSSNKGNDTMATKNEATATKAPSKKAAAKASGVKATAEAKKTSAVAAAAATKKTGDAAKATAKAAKAPKGDTTGRGRKSALAGKTLVATVKLDGDKAPINPRRVGSFGYNSLEIIIKAGKTGISTEDYLAAGGRMNDLNWDVEHGSVSAK